MNWKIKEILLKYIGKVICSKCGEKGYMKLKANKNTKTGKTYKEYLYVEHQDSQGNYLRSCYIGKDSRRSFIRS